MFKLIGYLVGAVSFISWGLNKVLGVLLLAMGEVGAKITEIANNAYWLFPASAALIVFGSVQGSFTKKIGYAVIAAIIIAGVMWFFHIA